MLPTKLRAELLERLSIKTMRYVTAVPSDKSEGLGARVYDMIAEDFFINGSLTSHSKVPALLAGVWTGGRESILVSDRLDRTTKEAMTAVLSQVNDCSCGRGAGRRSRRDPIDSRAGLGVLFCGTPARATHCRVHPVKAKGDGQHQLLKLRTA